MYNGAVESNKKRIDSHYKKKYNRSRRPSQGITPLFLRSFQRKKIKEAARDIRFFFTFWAKKTLLGCL